MSLASRLGLVIGFFGLGVCDTAASADTFYKYRDPQSGRDVFVNRVDQIPRPYRSRAKVVMEAADPPAAPVANEGNEPVAPASPGEAPAAEMAPVSPLAQAPQSVRALLAGKNLLKDGPAIAATMVDRRLAQAGTRPLDESERVQLAQLLGRCAGLLLAAGVLAFVVWLVMMVSALGQRKFGWAILMLLLWPTSYLYLLLHGGRGRVVLKLAGTAALASPAVVGLVAASWFSRWLHVVVQARGGRV